MMIEAPVRTILCFVMLGFGLGGCTGTHMLGGADGGPGGNGGSNQGGERCGNGIDDDGNGRIDEGCPCTTGTTQHCYRGPVSTRGRGVCHDGTQLCEGNAGEVSGHWGDCTGDELPANEMCGSDGNG